MKFSLLMMAAFTASIMLGTCDVMAKTSPARTRSNLIEMTFKSKVLNREKFDLGAVGASIGDQVIGNGDVLDINNNVIGTVEYEGLVTRINKDTEIRWLQAEYGFGDGSDSILMEGAEEFESPTGLPVLNRPQNFPITGGTGKYFGANGQCSVYRPDGLNFVTKCQFSVLKQPRW